MNGDQLRSYPIFWGLYHPHKCGNLHPGTQIRVGMDDLVNKLLELIDKPAFIKNELGIYTACNASFEKFLGISNKLILGKTAFDIAPTTLAKIYTEADVELFARRSVQIYRATVAGPRYERTVIFSKTVIFNEDDQLAGFVGTIGDMHADTPQGTQDKKINHNAINLTRREFEVLHLMSQGLTAKEIAKILDISYHTIGDYMKLIYLKLNVNNRISALIAAQKLYLI